MNIKKWFTFDSFDNERVLAIEKELDSLEAAVTAGSIKQLLFERIYDGFVVTSGFSNVTELADYLVKIKNPKYLGNLGMIESVSVEKWFMDGNVFLDPSYHLNMIIILYRSVIQHNKHNPDARLDDILTEHLSIVEELVIAFT